MRPSTRQDWLAAIALLAGLLVVFVVPPATTGSSAARSVAALAIAALVAFAVARSPFTFAPRIRTAFVLLVILALWYAATRLWALDPAGSMVESSRVSAFVLMAWAAHTCVVGAAARRLLLIGVGVFAAAITAPHLIDLIRDGVPTERVPGELGYWNATAVVALILVPLAVALAGSGRRLLMLLAALMIPLAGITAVATASRGALAALVVALVFQAILDPDYRGGLPRAGVALLALSMVIIGLTAFPDMPVAISLVSALLVAYGGFGLVARRRIAAAANPRATVTRLNPPAPSTDAGEQPARAPRRRLRLRPVTIVGGLLTGALAVLLVTLALQANRDQLPSPDRSAPEATRLANLSSSMRTEWWQIGLDIWRTAPIVGNGGSAFPIGDSDIHAPRPGHVHSLPLEVLIDTGIIGLALLAAASIQFLRVLRRGRRTTLRAAAGAIAALLIVQALVDWTLSLPALLALLAMTAPLAVQPPPDADEARLQERALPVWAPIAMLCSLAIATLVALVPMLATLLSDQATRAFDDARPLRAANLYAQSEQLVPSMQTLTLHVISLQAAGEDAEARDVMRAREQVWFRQRDGLLLARDVLGDDPDFGPRIDRRIAQLERERATQYAG